MSTDPDEDGGSCDPLEAAAESFLASLRRGERPSPDAYAARYPELAPRIRQLFPALVEIEGLPPDASGIGDRSGTGPAVGPTRLERLGDYRILRELGSGGMGVVYEAVRESLSSHVALKVMHPRFRADPAFVRRFRTEARLAARLHHTNIVSVFDFGVCDGVCYYAMQHIDGRGLDRVLEDVRRLRGPGGDRGPDKATLQLPRWSATLGPPSGHDEAHPRPGPCASGSKSEAGRPGPGGDEGGGGPGRLERSHGLSGDLPRTASACGVSAAGGSSTLPCEDEDRYFHEVARLASQAAAALAHAHRRGVLHRDVKPSNLLIDEMGSLWVTDFGLAKFEGGEDLSLSHDMVGTLRYMAPERFRGVSDRRCDVYALGATLYEMLALRPAFGEKDQLRLIERIVNDPVEPPRRIDRRIPRDLETIALKALSKDPADRFASADEMAAELGRFLERRPIRSRPIPAHERLWRWARRNPALAGLNALAATLIVAIAVVSAAAAYRNGRLAAEARANLLQSRKHLIQAYTSEAEAHRHGRRVGQRFEALGAIEKAAQLGSSVEITEADRLRLRNESIGALALPDLRVTRGLNVPRAKEYGLAVDSACERYAFKRDDGTILVRRFADDAELLRLPGLPPAVAHTQAGFSPDGRYLAMTSGGRDILEVWDVQRGLIVLTERELAPTNPVNWSFRPGGRELALPRKDRSIVVYELPSGRVLRHWTEARAGTTLAYGPDGSRLAVAGESPRVTMILSSDSGRLLKTLANPDSVNFSTWNPRRPDILATACEDDGIYLWDVAAGELTATLKGEVSNGIILAFHPGGVLLASRGWQGVIRLWDSRTGRMLLSRPSSWASTLEFDRLGGRLGVDPTPDGARVLEVADAAECRTLTREPFDDEDRHHALAIDPTGRRAVTSGTSTVIWDLPSGATLAVLPGVEKTHRIHFDASGAPLTGAPALLRWPVAGIPGGPTTAGPPQVLHPRGTREGSAITADGRTIAAAMFDDGGLVLDTQNPRPPRWLRPQRAVRTIAISPDGRWIVTGTHRFPGGMRLWESRTGLPIHDFPGIPLKAGVVPYSFSPDGRWLAVQWDGWLLLETKDWTTERRLSRGPTSTLAFASDSGSVAYDDKAGSIILADLTTGRELAKLEDPEQAGIAAVQFTPDGSRLVATLQDRPYLRAWDLRAIRRRLGELGLDWDPPATYGVATATGSFAPIPEPMHVDPGHLDSR